MSKLILASSVLSHLTVASYRSTRFGGQSGVTIAVGEKEGRVVAFWSPRGAGLTQVSHSFGSVSEAEKLPEIFKASTGLDISERSLRKLLGDLVPVLQRASKAAEKSK